MKWLAFALLAACDLTPDPRDTIGPLPDTVPVPADNPTTPESVELGRLLFWDPILSGDRDVACATCHHPDFAYSDGLPGSIGVGGRGVGPARAEASPNAPRIARNAQTVLGTGWNGLTNDGAVPPELAPMFWDNRAVSLEAQILGPIKSGIEMRGTAIAEDAIVDEVVARIAAIPEYETLFQAAFGEGVNATTLARAIAAFERTLVPIDSSFDRYLAGDDDAMTAVQLRGLRGFIDGGCSRCHSGPLLSDFKLHELPVPHRPGDPIDGSLRFRTPSLRMVSHTAPYMHNGAFATLDEVLDFYHNVEVTDPLLGGDVEFPLGGAEDLRAFFGALSDGTFDRTIPDRVPSGLPPGGS